MFGVGIGIEGKMNGIGIERSGGIGIGIEKTELTPGLVAIACHHHNLKTLIARPAEFT